MDCCCSFNSPNLIAGKLMFNVLMLTTIAPDLTASIAFQPFLPWDTTSWSSSWAPSRHSSWWPSFRLFSVSAWPRSFRRSTPTTPPSSSCLSSGSKCSGTPTGHFCFGSEVDVIKHFLDEIQISPKLRNWITFVLMIEPAQNRLKQCCFQLNYIQTLFICSKMVYSCCFSLGGNLDFIDFPQKMFYNINHRSGFLTKSSF